MMSNEKPNTEQATVAPMSAERLAEIKAREQAATPGEWYWNVNTSCHTVVLETYSNYRTIVMDCVRWGMGGAAPRFRDMAIDLMHRCETLLKAHHNREHHFSWCANIDHPDAAFIAHARADVPALLAEVERLRAENARLTAEIDSMASTLYHQFALCEAAKDDEFTASVQRLELREQVDEMSDDANLGIFVREVMSESTSREGFYAAVTEYMEKEGEVKRDDDPLRTAR